jgi:acyl carrier protein
MDKLQIRETVLAIVRGELKRDDIRIEDDFFAFNGDSVAALAVLTAIKEKIEVDVPVDTFFESESLDSLCSAIADLSNI